MKIPKIDPEELEEMKRNNFKDNLDFIDLYAEWVKKTPNKRWSHEQKVLIDSQIRSANEFRAAAQKRQKLTEKPNI